MAMSDRKRTAAISCPSSCTTAVAPLTISRLADSDDVRRYLDAAGAARDRLHAARDRVAHDDATLDREVLALLLSIATVELDLRLANARLFEVRSQRERNQVMKVIGSLAADLRVLVDQLVETP